MMRAAAVSALLAGLGFGIPGVAGAVHLARRGTTWTFLGFPTYGAGPFERWGLPTTVPLLAAFVAVCAVEVVLAVGLWVGSTTAAWAALVLLPVELAFWTGFALPFGFVLGLARTALVVLALVRGTAA